MHVVVIDIVLTAAASKSVSVSRRSTTIGASASGGCQPELKPSLGGGGSCELRVAVVFAMTFVVIVVVGLPRPPVRVSALSGEFIAFRGRESLVQNPNIV